MFLYVVFAGSKDGAAVSVLHVDDAKETSIQEMPKEREASSNSTGMKLMERDGTLSLMWVAKSDRQSPPVYL